MANNCNKTFRDLINDGEVKFLGVASIVPMGAWNATITYQKLNYVRHNGATYLAKTSSTNVEPGVAENWQNVWMLCNYDGGVSQVVSDGTYPNMTVGNATNAVSAQTAVSAQQALTASSAVKALNDENGNGIAAQFAAIKSQQKFYVSPTSENPASIFGGTWEQIEGQFVIAASSSYAALSTGGNSAHTHTAGNFTTQIAVNADGSGEYVQYGSGGQRFSVSKVLTFNNSTPGISIEDVSYSANGISVFGTSDSAPTMPPYISLYMWYRIS